MQSPFATSKDLLPLIRAAQAAPSVHNTQPWAFHIRSADRLELRVNGKRQLKAADPRARELTISCGAALLNLRLALRMPGYEPVEWLVPDPRNDPGLLASVEVMPGQQRPPTLTERELYDAIPRRHSNREPFTGPRVPVTIVAEMENAAWQEHVYLKLLRRRETRALLRVIAEADRELAADPLYVEELRRWTGDVPGEHGVPAAAFGPLPHGRLLGAARAPTRDLGLSRPDHRRIERFERRPQLLVLSTQNDRPLDWLHAGQALQRILLTATSRGLAASLLTQPFEVYDRRSEPQSCRPVRLRHGQVIIRLGYGPVVAATAREIHPEVMDCRIQPPLPMRLRAVS